MIISLIVMDGRHITILSGSQRVADSVLAELVVSEVIGVERFVIGAYHELVALLHLQRVAHLDLMLGVYWDFDLRRRLSYFNERH